jgi:hypothetical protein
MNRSRFFTLVVLVAFCLTCAGCGGGNNKAMSLQFFEKVYVSVDPLSLLSLDEALKVKGIGNVMSSDLKLRYVYWDSSFAEGTAPALVIYSDSSFLPSGITYMAMRVREFYEIAISDDKAAGIVVNPDVAGAQSYTMTRQEIAQAIPHIKARESLPRDISIVQ